MRTSEIEHEQRPHVLGEFSQLHHGEPVNVETLAAGVSAAEAAAVRSRLCGLPLVGIVGAVPKALPGEWIEIIAGDSPADAAIHSIANPSRVVIAEGEDGRGAALQIDSADGQITMVRCEPPPERMPPVFSIV
jgi:TusA-related sulfurtransferase